MTTYLDIHTLTTLGANNLNRGEEGAPKTTKLGGTTRQRVSSQSLKKAMRAFFESEGFDHSVRTRRYMSEVDRRLEESGVENYTELTDNFFKAFSGASRDTKGVAAIAAYSSDDFDVFAACILEDVDAFRSTLNAKGKPEFKPEKELTGKLKKLRNELGKSLDVSLFGRMMATDKSLNVDAASQVAHGIGTNVFETEYDFYTATDDLISDDEASAGMMGEIQYGSSILYRYANINLDALAFNLGLVDGKRPLIAETAQFVIAFVNAMVKSLPTGKQNSFAATVLPSYVRVILRDSQPMSMVAAFEKSSESVGDAIEALDTKVNRVHAMYGETPVLDLVVSEDKGSMSDLTDGLREAIEAL